MTRPIEEPLRALPDGLKIPRGADGEPVFREPWEARSFAMVVHAHHQGRFDWEIFQQLLIAEIRDSEISGEHRPYYLNWAIAAEKLFEILGSLRPQEVSQRVSALRPEDRTIRLTPG